jgi:hypothetical protein
MMECKGTQERLSAYLEGVVSPEERKLVEEHLNSCPQCRTAFVDRKRAAELIRDLEEVEPPAWLTSKIMSRVRAENESKRGVLRKLFYPLHIKVPIEAFATVLIAVIAVYVFKAVEPEMKRAQLPVPSAQIVTREEGPQPSRQAGAESPALRSKTTLKDHTSVAPARGGEAARKEEKPFSPGPAEETVTAKKKQVPAERPEEVRETAGALKKQGLAELRQAPGPAAREGESIGLADTARATRERPKLAAAPMAKEAAVIKPGPIDVTVNVQDVRVAGQEVEKILGQFGARKIERESREGRELLAAELKAQSVKEFLEKLKDIGETKEKGMPRDIPEGDLAIRVDIVRNP